MSKEDWGDSRWEYTKSKSNWHFDATKETTDYTPVCTFTGNWDNEIQECLGKVKPNTWGSRNIDLVGEKVYTSTLEENDLIKAGANPEMEIFSRANAKDIPIFQRIATYFGMKETSIKFHNQSTGQMLNWHIDNFAGRRERGNTFTEIEADKDPSLMRRFAIMLDDWKHGQVFQLGNSNWHQWKKGQCITWEWRDIPHGTCNMGWEDRPMLQVTGWTTDKTKEVVKLGDFKTTIKV